MELAFGRGGRLGGRDEVVVDGGDAGGYGCAEDFVFVAVEVAEAEFGCGCRLGEEEGD